MPMKRLLGMAVLAGAVGCGGTASQQDGRHPTGSQAMVSSTSFSALYAANPDDGTLVRFNTQDKSILRGTIGQEPTRVARVRDRLYVTLRAERAVAIVR